MIREGDAASVRELDRAAAKLVVLAVSRGDVFWQEQLQYAFDLTVAEAEELARDAA